MIRSSFCLVLLALAVGCSPPPPEAPTELGELNLYLYREFDHEDPLVMSAGLENLRDFLSSIEADVLSGEDGRDGRQWQPPVLTDDDRTGLPPIEGVDPEDQLAVSVAWSSPFDVGSHLPIVGLTDQTPVEAGSSASYERTFLTDVDCFLDGSCDLLRTFNEVHRDQLVLDIVYESFKDFRSFPLADGSGDALVARSWNEERFFGEAGQNSIDQSFSLEVWLPDDGATTRFMTYWNQMTIPAVSDSSLVLNLMGSGMDEIFENTDAFLAGSSD